MGAPREPPTPGTGATVVARASWSKFLSAMVPLALCVAMALAGPFPMGDKLVVAALFGLTFLSLLVVFGGAMLSPRGLIWVADGKLHNALHVPVIRVADITEVTYRPPDLRWALFTTFVANAPCGSRPITVSTEAGAYDLPASIMAAPEAAARKLRAIAGLPSEPAREVR